ncbi:MAG: AMP-binding protein [Granulosicoccus sp.]
MTYEVDDQTLVDVLQARVGSLHGITFVEGQNQQKHLSFSQMLDNAKRRLAQFQAAGVEPGHHMIIQSGDNALFLEAFWACLLGGIVAVPIAGGNSREHRLKLFRIAAMLEDSALFSDRKNLRRLQLFAEENDLAAQFTELESRCIQADTEGHNDIDPLLAKPHADDIAFIQFSSGSTSTPKGIVLTHRNLMTNTRSIIDGCHMTSQDHLLSWMPLTHDMGLIGFHLTPLVCDTSHSLMPTDLFVRRPGLWLSEAQQLQASILCSPNFGYQHLLKSFKPERYDGLDLSCVRLLFNGAEPISVSLCHEFMQTMKPFRLDSDAMMPVYGLAEASLAVTFPSLDNRFTALCVDRSSLGVGGAVRILDATGAKEGDNGIHLISVGRPVSHVQVAIRDDNNESSVELSTGRICIRGPNVTAGYYKEPELNAQMLDADGWLDTGDLGFLFEEQLYITGRAKDVIFINGQNVYPHDLEEILLQEKLIERGKIAIASQQPDDSGDEKLLVFVLHRTEVSDLEALARDITRTLGMSAGVGVDAVVAVPHIPKTTSGKVQRFELLKNYLAGQYESLQQEAAANAALQSENPEGAVGEMSDSESQEADSSTVARLLTLCNSHIEGMQLGLDDNLFELGISSLTLAEIHASIEDTWPDKVEITDLFDYPTVSELAAFLDNKA